MTGRSADSPMVATPRVTRPTTTPRQQAFTPVHRDLERHRPTGIDPAARLAGAAAERRRCRWAQPVGTSGADRLLRELGASLRPGPTAPAPNLVAAAAGLPREQTPGRGSDYQRGQHDMGEQGRVVAAGQVEHPQASSA